MATEELDTDIDCEAYLEGLEGAGMDVVIRFVDTEQEIADFLYECEEYFTEG
jgi:hypothetical protein|tara:strand:+ start:966 stop:1121 length:156 start_codon:yes stop_codon:yes gene_type:complete